MQSHFTFTGQKHYQSGEKTGKLFLVQFKQPYLVTFCFMAILSIFLLGCSYGNRQDLNLQAKNNGENELVSPEAQNQETGDDQKSADELEENKDQDPPPLNYVQVTGSHVNLRTGPGTDHPVITVVKKGVMLQELEHSGDWIRVLTPDGKEAFIAGWLTDAAVGKNDGQREQGAATQASLSWDDFKLGEIWLWDKLDEIKEKLGDPPVERTREEIQEGITIKTTSYYYRGLEITYSYDLSREVLVLTRLATDLAGYATSRGIQVGNSRQELLEIYGERPYLVDGRETYIETSLTVARELVYASAESKKVLISFYLNNDTIVKISLVDMYAI